MGTWRQVFSGNKRIISEHGSPDDNDQIVAGEFVGKRADRRGERPTPICMVAQEFRTGRTLRLWADELETMALSPFSTERDTLFVAYCAPVHDVLLVEGPLGEIDAVVSDTKAAMAEASCIVLGGFELRVDAKITSWPECYMDSRGAEMWKIVMGIVDELDGLAVNGRGVEH